MIPGMTNMKRPDVRRARTPRYLFGAMRAPVECLLVALLVLACGTSRYPPFDYAHEPDPRRQEYVIGSSDVLRISVWKNSELSTDATVRPDGTFTAALIGEVTASGRTATQVRNEVAKRLGAFLKDQQPQVDVVVREVNSYHFTVAGSVEHPGLYGSKLFVTVTEVLALAGGPTRHASLHDGVLIRPAAGSTRRIPVDILAIFEGSRPEMNLALLSGDTLYIP
jgi:polysaccharide export outer membrane protein